MNRLLLAASLAAGLATQAWAQSPKMKMTTAIPESITAPDKVDSSIGTLQFFDGVPTDQTVAMVYDYLDRSRAVNVFINSIPMLSMYTLREGQASVGADTCNKICIWDNLMVDHRRPVLEQVEKTYDIYFAPKPLKGKEGNWLQTVPGKSWWLALRMYGPKIN